jgi:hypothetical protein
MQAPKETIPSDTADELDEHIRRLSDILSSMARRCSSIMSTLDRMSTAYDMLSAVNYDPDPAPACDVDALLNPEDAMEHIRETNSLLDARKYIEDGPYMRILYMLQLVKGMHPDDQENIADANELVDKY